MRQLTAPGCLASHLKVKSIGIGLSFISFSARKSVVSTTMQTRPVYSVMRCVLQPPERRVLATIRACVRTSTTIHPTKPSVLFVSWDRFHHATPSSSSAQRSPTYSSTARHHPRIEQQTLHDYYDKILSLYSYYTLKSAAAVPPRLLWRNLATPPPAIFLTNGVM